MEARDGLGDGVDDGLGLGLGEGDGIIETVFVGVGLATTSAFALNLLVNQNPPKVSPYEPTITITNKSHLGNGFLALIGITG